MGTPCILTGSETGKALLGTLSRALMLLLRSTVLSLVCLKEINEIFTLAVLYS